MLDNGKLTTKLYRKPTDKHQYLHFESSHLKHWKTSIPYSQAIRFKRICSHKSDFVSNCAQLRSALIRQKFPPRLIDDAVVRANALDRDTLIAPKKNPPHLAQTNLVLNFSASVPKVAAILEKHHNILLQSDRLKDIFHEPLA